MLSFSKAFFLEAGIFDPFTFAIVVGLVNRCDWSDIKILNTNVLSKDNGIEYKCMYLNYDLELKIESFFS